MSVTPCHLQARISPGVSSGVVARLALVQRLTQPQLAVLESPARNGQSRVKHTRTDVLLEAAPFIDLEDIVHLERQVIEASED